MVRNGEGVHHVIRVTVHAALPTSGPRALVAKAVVNSPLLKAAVNGNDPNVGRLLCAVGKWPAPRASRSTRARPSCGWAGRSSSRGAPCGSSRTRSSALVAHLRSAELYASAPPVNGVLPAARRLPAPRAVRGDGDRPGRGHAAATVLGADLSHEYVSENADYRS